MKILFVSNICDFNRHDIPAGYQAAAMTWQKKLVQGLDEQPGVEVEILGSPLIPFYSNNYRVLFSRGYSWSRKKGTTDSCVGFLNVFPIRNYFIKCAYKKAIKKWVEKNTGEELRVITYSPRDPFISAAKYASALGIKNCAIIPDLPEYSGISRMNETLYRFMKAYDIKSFYRKSKKVYSFILFSKHMVEKFHNPIKYEVIECICEADKDIAFEDAETDETKRVVYTGGIEWDYGVCNLIDAFRRIKGNNYLLELCGDGSAMSYAVRAARDDSRIILHGSVTHEKALEIQRKATVLVNPRTASGVFTRYSFPSKNAEYLKSGKPVLCFKLEGIPDEFDSYFTYFKDDTPETMAESIVNIAERSFSERKMIGLRNYNFATQKKSANVQAKKLIKIIQ